MIPHLKKSEQQERDNLLERLIDNRVNSGNENDYSYMTSVFSEHFTVDKDLFRFPIVKIKKTIISALLGYRSKLGLIMNQYDLEMNLRTIAYSESLNKYRQRNCGQSHDRPIWLRVRQKMDEDFVRFFRPQFGKNLNLRREINKILEWFKHQKDDVSFPIKIVAAGREIDRTVQVIQEIAFYEGKNERGFVGIYVDYADLVVNHMDKEKYCKIQLRIVDKINFVLKESLKKKEYRFRAYSRFSDLPLRMYLFLLLRYHPKREKKNHNGYISASYKGIKSEEIRKALALSQERLKKEYRFKMGKDAVKRKTLDEYAQMLIDLTIILLEQAGVLVTGSGYNAREMKYRLNLNVGNFNNAALKAGNEESGRGNG